MGEGERRKRSPSLSPINSCLLLNDDNENLDSKMATTFVMRRRRGIDTGEREEKGQKRDMKGNGNNARTQLPFSAQIVSESLMRKKLRKDSDVARDLLPNRTVNVNKLDRFVVDNTSKWETDMNMGLTSPRAGETHHFIDISLPSQKGVIERLKKVEISKE